MLSGGVWVVSNKMNKIVSQEWIAQVCMTIDVASGDTEDARLFSVEGKCQLERPFSGWALVSF